MAVRFVTVAEVRVLNGITSTDISDADVTEMIEDVEYQIERFLNSSLDPVTEIDVMDGNGKSVIFTKRAPLLALLSLESNSTSISVANTDVKKSGYIRLATATEAQIFTAIRRGVVIKYIYGRRSWDRTTETTTDSAAVAGSSIALSVVSETGFTTGDWIEVYGTDKHKEVAKITGTASGTITVDTLSLTHASGSLVRKMIIDPIIERLIKICSALAMVARIVGESATDITGYTIGEFQVQKGEPFTQWRETALQLMKQRDEIMARVDATPGIEV